MQKDTTPLVSVLTTVYNQEGFLPECIESVLASSLRDFEYIIVDDRSSDKSHEVALRYQSQDQRIKVHRNEKNLGDYVNRNRAASYARGKYLKYVDHDDYIYPRGLELLVETMERFPEAGWGLASLDPDKDRPFPFQLSPTEAYRRHYFREPLFHKAPLSAIVRRDAFNAVGGFSGKRSVGDFEMWHLLGARFPVVLMPQGVVWYRESSSGELGFVRRSKLVQFQFLCTAYDQLSFPQCPLASAEKAEAIGKIRRAQARVILRTAAAGQFGCSLEMLKLSGLAPGEVMMWAFRPRGNRSKRWPSRQTAPAS